MNHQNNIVLGLCLAFGLSACGYFISQTIYNSKVAMNTAEAKGLAERRVSADKANWTLIFRVSSKDKNDISKLYAQAEERQKVIIKMLTANGFSKEEIEIGVIDYKVQG